jgi:hypothetical protein
MNSLVFAQLPRAKCSCPVSSFTTPIGVHFSLHPMSWSTAWLSPRVLPPGVLANVHRGLAVHAQSHDRTLFGCLVLFLHVGEDGVGFWNLFWGLALTTGRSRQPLRFKTSAIVLAEGSTSSPNPELATA